MLLAYIKCQIKCYPWGYGCLGPYQFCFAIKFRDGWAGWLNAQLVEPMQVCCIGQQALKESVRVKEEWIFLINPCGSSQEWSTWNGLKSGPKEMSRSKQRKAGDTTGFVESEDKSTSQDRGTFTLPVKLQGRRPVMEGHPMTLESIIRESVVNIWQLQKESMTKRRDAVS